jgi:hypothetical protein
LFGKNTFPEKNMAKRGGNCLLALVFFATLWNLNIPLVQAQAIPRSRQAIKYLNPIHEKSYLNECQDRVIKKKSFKSTMIDGAEPIANREVGLFASVENSQLSDGIYLEELLNRPEVSGVACLLTWSQLEPTENVYNWHLLDELLGKLSRNQKLLLLRVSTCGVDAPTSQADKANLSDTPKWVFDAGVKALPYTGRDSKEHLMPIYWDSTYLAKWSNFIHELGARYDKNTNMHSIGITGGGALGSTLIVPDFLANKANYDALEQKLKTEFGMNPRQLVEHWKYVADLFPKAFPTARLNFDIDPPTPNRAGQDTLDEICDYLVFRYGERIYLTRQNVCDAKHGFDQYRILLKFRPDTLTGYELSSTINPDSLDKIAKLALDDGISFAEVPAQFFSSKDARIKTALEQLRAHLGYQLVSQKIDFPSNVRSGEPLRAAFTFLNLGAAAPMKPSRYLDKDRASSYRIQLELRDSSGKPVVLSLHTPSVPTNRWATGKSINWEEELKMPKLPPGTYSVWVSLVDTDSKRKLNVLDATSKDRPRTKFDIAAGSVKVVE